MSIKSLLSEKDYDYDIAIKHIDNKTKAIFYKNTIKSLNKIQTCQNNNFIESDLNYSYIRKLEGLNLETLEKIKKKLDDSI